MFLGCSKLLKISYTFQIKKYIHKYFFKMEKAYLRHLENGDQFELALKYSNDELRINRQFNFSRKLSESIETFTNRVATNVEKIMNKKSKKRKVEGTAQVETKLDVKLLLNNVEVQKDVPCKDVFQLGNDVTLKIDDKHYKVIVNSPWIDNLSLPMSILAGFPTYPSKFESVFTDKNLSEFIWYKSIKDEDSWITVGHDYIYSPSNEDINYYLKVTCTPKNEQSEGPTVECISVCRVEANPGHCPFEVRHQFTKQRTQENELRIVTYNILADLYCDSDYTRTVLHPYCPPYALEIDYRKQLILKEIIGYNSDIICLQEVDKKVFKYDLEPVLDHLGYGSNFFPKGNEVAEGLALFYYKEHFKLLESHRFVFSEHISSDIIFADMWEKISKNENLVKRILDRSTTLQVNVLELLNRDEILVVANTHLYFHPDADHIRLLHGGLAIRYLEHFISSLKEKTPKRVSLIFCGDFNSVPECGIYKLYTEGNVPKDYIDYQSNKDEIVVDLELNQSFKLSSACGTPKYTNYTAGFADCLDYIYYEKDHFEVSQIIPLPSHEEVIANTALPSVVFPSDHIALISDLRWL